MTDWLTSIKVNNLYVFQNGLIKHTSTVLMWHLLFPPPQITINTDNVVFIIWEEQVLVQSCVAHLNIIHIVKTCHAMLHHNVLSDRAVEAGAVEVFAAHRDCVPLHDGTRAPHTLLSYRPDTWHYDSMITWHQDINSGREITLDIMTRHHDMTYIKRHHEMSLWQDIMTGHHDMIS